MNKYYMTKYDRAYEFIFDGNSLERINEIRPIHRLGSLKEYSDWTEEKKDIAKKACDMLGI